ncbi:MAG: hypothetical protein RLY57_24 [Candidatus Parcubacteria bacterium]|jgi:hypothetical protein
MPEEAPKDYYQIRQEKIEGDEIEGKVLSFDDLERGKSTDLKINKINRILGSGSYASWVAEVNVELAKDQSSEKKTHNMVMKRYREEGTDATRNLERSYRNHRTLQSKGIPTWDTYRINEEHKLALMTLGIKDNETLLTATDIGEHPSIELFKQNPLEEVANFDDFVEQVKSILIKANENIFRLRVDMWGVVFKPIADNPGAYELRAIVADLDSLDRSEEPFYQRHYGADIKQRWVQENLDNLSAALFGIYPGNREEKRSFADLIIEKVK